jgi:hypothetical protein
MMANESELERAKRMSGSMNEAVEFLKAEKKWPHESERDRQMREAKEADKAERERGERWHATYNAALTGLRAFSVPGLAYSHEEVRKIAGADADAAHGKLNP